MSWFNTRKVAFDSVFHVVGTFIVPCIWLWTGHATPHSPGAPSFVAALGLLLPLLPAAAGSLLDSHHSPERRELLLVAAKLGCSILNAHMTFANSALPQRLRPVPLLAFVALVQLSATICLRVRLSAFLPLQLFHVVLAILGMGPHATALHAVQLFGFFFCLPVLLLYVMELSSRNAFHRVAGLHKVAAVS